MPSQLWLNVKSFLRPDSAPNLAIPALDGGLTHNDDLDEFQSLAVVDQPRDLVARADGTLVVAAGSNLLGLDPNDGHRPYQIATFDGDATGVCCNGDDLLVSVAGLGLVRIDPHGRHETLIGVNDRPSLANITSVAAVGPDVYITVGSQQCSVAEWPMDLMTKGSSGELLKLKGDGKLETLLEGLAWPAGVCEFAGEITFSEAWRHRLVQYTGNSEPRELRGRIPGYPGHLHASSKGTLWVAIFAMRTYLVDFVLREDRYRSEMIRTVPMEDWIRPSYRTTNQVREPLQLGGIRALGETKPWAPPRSYGLIAALDRRGEFVQSHHSRPGAKRHGIVGVFESGSDLFCVSAATGEILRQPASDGRNSG